jgi:hypothetical protein
MARWFYWLVLLLWGGMIFWLSSSPDAQGASGWIDLSHPVDKIVHAGVFGVFAALLYGATGRPALSVVLTSLYGISDELHQAFVPGRHANPWDWVADTLGAVVAVSLVVFLTRKRHRGPDAASDAASTWQRR